MNKIRDQFNHDTGLMVDSSGHIDDKDGKVIGSIDSNGDTRWY